VNRPRADLVSSPDGGAVVAARPAEPRRRQMTLWQKLFSRKAQPGKRVRICVECGMPIGEHKDWCSILRTQQEYDRKAAKAQS
jgi:hypothetical protein